MAVYTDVTEGELEVFLRNYPVGDLLSYKGIAEGTENSNFLLHDLRPAKPHALEEGDDDGRTAGQRADDVSVLAVDRQRA